ncbi:hypothetical protein, partial [Hoeflea sp.]|uniref:hypothetical protein n=1 Tax=Hoeflea sp. TaxID=1940281 RepID=UPI00199301E0
MVRASGGMGFSRGAADEWAAGRGIAPIRNRQYATRADAAAASVPAGIERIMVNGHTAEGDAPPALFRRATVAEEALPGVLTTADTAKWVFADNELVPEWFGAVADATGLTGVGTDNTAALQNLLTMASALKV